MKEIPIEAKQVPKEEAICSFCGKHKDEIAVMMAAKEAFICNECVSVCADVLFDQIIQFSKGVKEMTERYSQ